MKAVEKMVAKIFEIAAGKSGDGLNRTEAKRTGQKSQQFPQCIERPGSQSFPDDGFIDGPRRLHETIVTGGILRVEAGHLGTHPLPIGRIVEIRTVVKVHPIKRIERDKLDVVFKRSPGRGKQTPQDRRRCNETGAHVERIAAISQLIGSAAHFFSLFQQCRLEAHGLQANGNGQTSESTSDHNGTMFFHVRI